jgi:hypothetical protein
MSYIILKCDRSHKRKAFKFEFLARALFSALFYNIGPNVTPKPLQSRTIDI